MSTPPRVQGHGRQMTTSPLVWKPCSLPHILVWGGKEKCLAKEKVLKNAIVLANSKISPSQFSLFSAAVWKKSFAVALFFRLCYLCIWSECAQRCCVHAPEQSVSLFLLSRALLGEVQADITAILKIRISFEVVGHHAHHSWTAKPSSHRCSRKSKGRQADGGQHIIFFYFGRHPALIPTSSFCVIVFTLYELGYYSRYAFSCHSCVSPHNTLHL